MTAWAPAPRTPASSDPTPGDPVADDPGPGGPVSGDGSPGTPTSSDGSPGTPTPGNRLTGGSAASDSDDGAPLTEEAAEAHIHGICFKTGPPGRVGVELEWLVSDLRDPTLRVPMDRVTAVVASLTPGDPGAVLPGGGRITIEPGGQLELSSAPATSLGGCVAAAGADLARLRDAAHAAGLTLSGYGLDPLRPPQRVLDLPRYAAMEKFFDRRGPWGRVMMCNTASVQVCLDAGYDTLGADGYRARWHLVHAIGPVLVAAFANSPLREGRLSGWRCTRQVVWSHIDPGRTRAPAGAEPTRPGSAAGPPGGAAGPPGGAVGSPGGATGSSGGVLGPPDGVMGPPGSVLGLPGDAVDSLRGAAGPLRDAIDPRETWARYALDAELMCVRRDSPAAWDAPPGVTFRDWLRGAGERRPTASDLRYHLSTLFPPVRPQGHLELRMIDAQPGDDGWIVPAAVASALVDDPRAADAALAAVEPLWASSAGGFGAATAATGIEASPWLRAARHGPADAAVGQAALACFEAADAALGRAGVPTGIRDAVAAFAERYVLQGRCPADDRLKESR